MTTVNQRAPQWELYQTAQRLRENLGQWAPYPTKATYLPQIRYKQKKGLVKAFPPEEFETAVTMGVLYVRKIPTEQED